MVLDCNYLNETLFFQIFVCLAVIDIPIVILELFHCLLLENLVATLLLQFFGNYIVKK